MSVNGAGRVRFPDFAERLERNPQRRPQQHRGDDGGGNGFGLAVAIGMVLIRRHRGHDQSAPHDK